MLSAMPHAPIWPIFWFCAQAIRDGITLDIMPFLRALNVIAKTMVEKSVLPGYAIFRREKPFPVRNGLRHRQSLRKCGDEVKMIWHDERYMGMPFADFAAIFDGVENSRGKGFLGERPAPPGIGRRDSIVRTVDANGDEEFCSIDVLGHASWWRMWKTSPYRKDVRIGSFGINRDFHNAYCIKFIGRIGRALSPRAPRKGRAQFHSRRARRARPTIAPYHCALPARPTNAPPGISHLVGRSRRERREKDVRNSALGALGERALPTRPTIAPYHCALPLRPTNAPS